MKAISQPDHPRFDEIEALHQEIGRLPEKISLPTVILCTHLEGHSHAEAARVLQCPAGTVSIRVSRAKDLLRDRLTRRGLAFATVASSALALSESAAAATANAMPLGLAESTIKAAMQVAAGNALTAGTVSAAVSQLTGGALRTMTLQRITIAAALVVTTGSAASGIALLATGQPAAFNSISGQAATTPKKDQDPPDQKPKQGFDENAIAQARIQSVNNLKFLALAFHNLAQMNDPTSFPPAAIRSKDGKPLLSWRVAALPYLEQKPLYDKFHLDEPWDSPHNKALLKEITSRNLRPRASHRRAASFDILPSVHGPRAPCLRASEARLWPRSRTVPPIRSWSWRPAPMPWTKPEDIEYDKKKPLPQARALIRRRFPRRWPTARWGF